MVNKQLQYQDMSSIQNNSTTPLGAFSNTHDLTLDNTIANSGTRTLSIRTLEDRLQQLDIEHHNLQVLRRSLQHMERPGMSLFSNVELSIDTLQENKNPGSLKSESSLLTPNSEAAAPEVVTNIAIPPTVGDFLGFANPELAMAGKMNPHLPIFPAQALGDHGARRDSTGASSTGSETPSLSASSDTPKAVHFTNRQFVVHNRPAIEGSGSTEPSAVDLKWGKLFDEHGRSTPRLEQVLRGIAAYLVCTTAVPFHGSADQMSRLPSLAPGSPSW